ncbi:MAG: hypothetical protein ACLTBR_02920 [Anaerostipes sp.]|uniref:hypothetical protein n=1 Tax=Anaerostipes sp. TaxID=1872530 RepID=UPI0039940105
MIKKIRRCFCDKCGKEIKCTFHNRWADTISIGSMISMTYKQADLVKDIMTTKGEECCGAEIVTKRRFKIDTIHLCPECCKKFKQFLKN